MTPKQIHLPLYYQQKKSDTQGVSDLNYLLLFYSGTAAAATVV
jgi:hypothetical protein